jgi:site-specific recombinase XerD
MVALFCCSLTGFYCTFIARKFHGDTLARLPTDRIKSVHLRERKLKSGKAQLFLDLYDGERQWQEATGILLTGDRTQDRLKRQAGEQIRAKKESAILREAIGGVPVERKGVPFFKYARQIADHKRGTTRVLYIDALEQFSSFAVPVIGETATFEQINSDLCERYRRHLLSGSLKHNTAAAYFFKLKAVLKQAVRDQIISKSPADDMSIRPVETPPKFLTIEELQKLAETKCGNDIVRDAFFFSCLTSLSFSDVVNLRWNNLREGRIDYIRQKTKQPVSLKLNPEALEIIHRQRHRSKTEKTTTTHASDAVFKLPSRQTVDKLLKRWAKHANLNIPLSMHKARHTFGTSAHSSGADIYTIASMMGHKNVQMTQKYAKVLDPRKDEAVARLPRIEPFHK